MPSEEKTVGERIGLIKAWFGNSSGLTRIGMGLVLAIIILGTLYLSGCGGQAWEKVKALDWEAYLGRATCNATQLASLRHEFASLPDDERGDQLAHWEAGSLAARGWMKFGKTESEAVALVMQDAELRECKQSPPEKQGDCGEGSKPQWCGEGCEQDLRFWRLGAEAGAMCAAQQLSSPTSPTPSESSED